MTSAAQRWSDDLASWAIPPEILAAAPESPWIHPVEMFTVTAEVDDSPSHRRAREVLPEGGSVLDVGSGGGRASMALVPPATLVVGVDEQQEMLDRYAAAAAERGVAYEVHVGRWPEVSADVPVADVVVCHHVAYNVADLVPFVRALTAHARRRVVLELPTTHPLANLTPYWRRFWDLERPTGPTAEDCLAVVRESGAAAHLETWVDQDWGSRSSLTLEQRAHYTRIRLCLPADREPDVAQALRAAGDSGPRHSATIWWDVE